MKTLRVMLVAMMVAFYSSVADAQQAGALDTVWTTNVWIGFTHARDRGVPLVIALAEVDGCQPCASLARDIKNTPDILALRKTTELVWLNPAVDDQNKNVAKVLNSLGIEGYPTTVVLDLAVENGVVQALVERGRVTGYFPREDFMQKLRAILNAPPAKAPPPSRTASEAGARTGAQQLPALAPASGARTPSGTMVPRPKM